MSVRNEAERLAPALTALASQTVSGDEIIVVDDGSTDATRAIAEGIARRFPAVRIRSNPRNIGVIATISSALPDLRGDYVGLFAADETPHAGLFEAIRRAATAWPQAGVVATAAAVTVVGPVPSRRVYDFGLPGPAGHLDGPALAQACGKKYLWFASPATFMRRSALGTGIGWRVELDWLADWVQVYDLALRLGVAYVSAPLVEMEERADSFGASRRRGGQTRDAAVRAFFRILGTSDGQAMRLALREAGLLLPYAFTERVFADLAGRPSDWDLLLAAAIDYVPHRIRASLRAAFAGEYPFGARMKRD